MSWFHTLQSRWTAPTQLAWRRQDEALTYAQLEATVARCAGWLLAQGLQRGDVLALQTRHDTAFLCFHLAALSQGIATLPLHPSLPEAPRNQALEDGQARWALLDAPEGVALPTATLHQAWAEARTVSPRGAHPDLTDDDLALLCFTSGTTGRPKGAELTHGSLRGTVEALHTTWGWQRDDVLLHALPLFHIHGLIVAAHGALHAGATVHRLPRFHAEEVARTLHDAPITVYMGVPTHYHRLLDLPRPWSVPHMRLFTSGSAPLRADVHEAFQQRVGHAIVERYDPRTDRVEPVVWIPVLPLLGLEVVF